MTATAPAVVRFEPGCQLSPGLSACGPGGVIIREVGVCEGDCGRPDARRVAQYPNSGYLPPTFLCECGDATHDSWVVTPGGDTADARAAGRQRFGQRWEQALPEGTAPIYDPDLAWLTGVRLPDGTEVSRDDSTVQVTP